ncbi:RCC1 and BTB domain-containing protein 1-like [Nylanderia fulva]|uniref:RCC1 and BTB domain-containing protein 1-like n=1 Tax=Nylanderia fulva TaxID=613905 RepID=UPI0010FAFA45|nr:RCC1 and BTB domain-containing protein 1-like [Nylanderia fulva]
MQADESDVMLAEGKRIFVKPEKYLYPPAFRNWPILNLLDLGFIMQIRMVMVYGYGNKALIVTKNKRVYALDYNEKDHFVNDKTLYPEELELPLQANIKTIACSAYFVYVLFENGKVYFWRHMRTAVRSFLFNTQGRPARVNILNNKYIVDIACGSSHCLALTEDGQVYTWGRNKCGQIGNGDCSDETINLPTQVELEGRKIVHIACGKNFNMVITDTGKLYGWGNNKNSEISIFVLYRQYYHAFPEEIITGKRIKKVSCGFEHILALTDRGDIYAWGKNISGQIGNNSDLPICSVPMMVNMPELVKDIAAYGYLSVALSNNNTVYVWGDCFGQYIKVPLPTKFSGIQDAFAFTKLKVMCKPLIVSDSDLEGMLNIFNSLKVDVPRVEFDDPEEEVQKKRLKLSTNEIIVLTDKRRVLLVDLEKCIYPPAFRNWPILNLLDLEFIMQIRMVVVYVGDGNKALIVTKNKKVYTLDYNKDDHLNIKTPYPRQLEELFHKNIKTVAFTAYFVYVLFENGEVYFWEHIEDILDKKIYFSKTDFTPARLVGLDDKYIVDIACGMYHCLALTEDGQVYTWGRNDWGQLGTETAPTKPSVCQHKLNWKDERLFILPAYYHAFPEEIITGKRIKKVSCGFEHILALTDRGDIYAWGKNHNGQVGTNSDLPICSVPMMVDMPESVKDIAAYGHLSVALSNNNIVYVWGDCFGQHIKIPLPTKFSGIQDAFAFSKFKVTFKPLIVSDSDVKGILHIFELIDKAYLPGMKFNDPTTNDIIIKIGEDQIFAHESILKIRSQYFKNKFDQRDWIENNKRLVGLPVYNVPDKFSYIVYKTYIQYLYTGKVDLLLTNISELITLADKYYELRLKEKLMVCLDK